MASAGPRGASKQVCCPPRCSRYATLHQGHSNRDGMADVPPSSPRRWLNGSDTSRCSNVLRFPMLFAPVPGKPVHFGKRTRHQEGEWAALPTMIDRARCERVLISRAVLWLGFRGKRNCYPGDPSAIARWSKGRRLAYALSHYITDRAAPSSKLQLHATATHDAAVRGDFMSSLERLVTGYVFAVLHMHASTRLECGFV